jgi:photosystem II stability/assembly factor-like uncharacterized protein
VALVVLAGLAAALSGAVEVAAHTPHDVIRDVSVSPGFERDRTVFTIARSYVLRSTDGGATFERVVNGLDHKSLPAQVAVSGADPDTVYLTAGSDQVYRSTDGGDSWAWAKGDGLAGPVTTLAASPHDAGLLMVSGSQGTFRSVDGGAHWGAVSDARVETITFATDSPTTVFAGDSAGTLYTSHDAGASFEETPVLFGADGFSEIVVSPDFETDHMLFIGTDANGVLASSDGGASFAQSSDGLSDRRVVSIAISDEFASDETIYLSTFSDGVFRSSDAGASWQLVDSGLTRNEQADQIGAAHFSTVAAVPGTGGRELFVGAFEGLFGSSDAGDRWMEFETQPAGSVVGLDVSPAYLTDGSVAASTYINGAFRSTDRGDSWSPINDGLATWFEWIRQPDYFARLFDIHFSPTFAQDDTMYTGTRGYFLMSEDGGRRWQASVPDGLLVAGENTPDYWFTAFSPAFGEDSTIVLGTDGGKVLRSTDGGHSFTRLPDLGREFTALAISSEFDLDRTLIAGTIDGVFISADAGESWAAAAALPDQRITSLAISPDFASDQVIFVGTMAGAFTSADGGRDWQQLVGHGWAEDAQIEAVALSPAFASDGTVLLTAKGRGLFRSTDGGASFESIGSDLLADHFVFSDFYHSTSEPIVFSPDYAQDRTIFGLSGTEIFRSADGGDTWTRLHRDVSLHDIAEVAAPAALLRTPRFDCGNMVRTAPECESPAPGSPTP